MKLTNAEQAALIEDLRRIATRLAGASAHTEELAKAAHQRDVERKPALYGDMNHYPHQVGGLESICTSSARDIEAIIRRLAADLTAQYEFCEQYGYGFKARSAFDAIGQLIAGAEMAEECDLIALQFDAAGIDRTLPLARQAQALQEKWHAAMLRDRQTEALAEQRLLDLSDRDAAAWTLRQQLEGLQANLTDVRRERDALRAQLAERPALTADEVRAAVREAIEEAHNAYATGHIATLSERAGMAARLAAEKLAGRSLTGFGHERAAIIDQALAYWDRDLTAPHAQIAEIRKLIGGGS